METPFDQCLKDVIVDGAAQLKLGLPSTEHEVHTHNQFIDLYFSPAALPPTAFAPLGLLGRILSQPAAIEGYHCTPKPEDMAGSQRKHQNFCYELARKAPPLPEPTLWLISSGRPVTGIEGYGYQPAPDWPAGVYKAAPLFRFALVVASELPVTRETVLLRLMGAGLTLRQALAELTAMPEHAFERRLALPIVTRLRIKIENKPAPPGPEEQEFLMNTQEWYETWKKEQRQEGREEGLRTARHALIRFYETLFGAMSEPVRARIEAATDTATLDRWTDLIAPGQREDIDRAILGE